MRCLLKSNVRHIYQFVSVGSIHEDKDATQNQKRKIYTSNLDLKLGTLFRARNFIDAINITLLTVSRIHILWFFWENSVLVKIL